MKSELTTSSERTERANISERQSPGHPGLRSPLSRQASEISPRHTPSRFHENLPTDYFQVKCTILDSPSQPEQYPLPTSPENSHSAQTSPAATLRAKQIRASNSTPSMLIRHVQQQTSEATAALKNSSNAVSPPTTPQAMAPVRTLSHRKSAKNLKISSPKLLTASTDLDSMPSIDNTSLSQHGSPHAPELSRKQSSAGLKFKMRFNKISGSNSVSNHSEEYDRPSPKGVDAVSSRTKASTTAESGSINSPEQEDRSSESQGGIKNLMSRLRRKKNSLEVSPGSYSEAGSPDAKIYREMTGASHIDRTAKHKMSKPDSSPPSMDKYLSSRSPETYPVGLWVSVNSNTSGSKAKTAALEYDIKTCDGIPPQVTTSMSSPVDGRLLRDRRSAASSASMKNLYDAAAALGIDPGHVNEMVDTAGHLSPKGLHAEEKALARSTVTLPYTESTTSADRPSISSIQSFVSSSDDKQRSGGTSSAVRRSVSEQNHKSPSLVSRHSPRSVRHRRLPSVTDAHEAAQTHSVKRSLHDRPSTPPPARERHRSRKSDVELVDNPLPLSPLLSSRKMLPTKSNDNVEDFSRNLPPFSQSRMSVVSGRSMGSYDAKSIYGLYGDDDPDEMPPPPPGLKAIDLVLASVRIPAASSETKRGSLALAPGVDIGRLSTASRHSRIELAEYDNGDIAFNVIQSLRSGANTGDRTSFFPVDLHRRQASDISLEEAIGNKSNGSPVYGTTFESDPLRLMVRRYQKSRKDAEASKAIDSPIKDARETLIVAGQSRRSMVGT